MYWSVRVEVEGCGDADCYDYGAGECGVCYWLVMMVSVSGDGE